MMNTAFSSGSKLLYTSATVAKPSLSSATLWTPDVEEITDEEDRSAAEDSCKLSTETEELDSEADDSSFARCSEETGRVADSTPVDDPSGESSADDPPNIFRELGISRSDELDSIFDISEEDTTSAEPLVCTPEAQSEPPHATSIIESAMAAAGNARITLSTALYTTTPTGIRQPRTPDFRR